MGPPIFIGGNAGCLTETAHTLQDCFNGAADFHRRKYPVCNPKLIFFPIASMGPPIFIGGNARTPGAGRTSRACFNGAADFHRRKSRLVCPLNFTASGFNGAADFHRRKWLALADQEAYLKCFNGAADFHRRKSQERLARARI